MLKMSGFDVLFAAAGNLYWPLALASCEARWFRKIWALCAKDFSQVQGLISQYGDAVKGTSSGKDVLIGEASNDALFGGNVITLLARRTSASSENHLKVGSNQ